MDVHSPLHMNRGPAWRNRLVLSALTNTQSNDDGTLTDDEIGWLLARARTGFGMILTAAAFVAPEGRAWQGQLGVNDDAQLPGLARLADGLREAGAVSSVQLHHGGYRAEHRLAGPKVSSYERDGARAMTTGEVRQVIDDFAAAAARTEHAGFDGAEIHGAHGYLLNQFLERENQRDDGYGGDLAGRARILHEIADAIRSATSPGFQLGIRLSAASPEEEEDLLRLATSFLVDDRLDYVEASVWDYRRLPAGAQPGEPALAQTIAALPRANRLGFTGQIRSRAAVDTVLGWGADFVSIGRGAIADHRFAERCLADPAYPGPSYPVTRQHLRDEHLGEAFVEFFAKGWPDYVTE